MITINGKQFGNLEETVQWTVDNIKNIYDTGVILSEFGIKVVGQVATLEELMEKYPPEAYTGEYGDAILLGTSAPYDYMVYTRPFEGEEHGQWFNIGQFPLPGPQGPVGPTGSPGEHGERGNYWYTGVGRPGVSILAPKEGDLYLETNTNNVWKYQMGEWVTITTVKGDPGTPGAEGPMGPAGPVVDIIAKLGNTNQLPSTDTALELYGRQAAYLIPKNGVEGERLEVWALTGPDNDLRWSNLGLFASGTVVYYQGIPTETLNIDNYIRSINTPLANTRYVYTGYNNNVSLRKVTANTFEADTFPWRGAGGHIKVPGNPTDPNHATSKSYVDAQIENLRNQILGIIDSYH